MPTSHHRQHTHKKPRKSTRLHHSRMTNMRNFWIFLILVSLFFWGWALKNTLNIFPMVDGGVVSFFTVVVTSTYALCATTASATANNDSAVAEGTERISQKARRLITSSHVLVAVNYALGCLYAFLIAERTSFGIYCVVFTILWLGIAKYGHDLMTSADTAPYSCLAREE